MNKPLTQEEYITRLMKEMHKQNPYLEAPSRRMLATQMIHSLVQGGYLEVAPLPLPEPPLGGWIVVRDHSGRIWKPRAGGFWACRGYPNSSWDALFASSSSLHILADLAWWQQNAAYSPTYQEYRESVSGESVKDLDVKGDDDDPFESVEY